MYNLIQNRVFVEIRKEPRHPSMRETMAFQTFSVKWPKAENLDFPSGQTLVRASILLVFVLKLPSFSSIILYEREYRRNNRRVSSSKLS